MRYAWVMLMSYEVCANTCSRLLKIHGGDGELILGVDGGWYRGEGVDGINDWLDIDEGVDRCRSGDAE